MPGGAEVRSGGTALLPSSRVQIGVRDSRPPAVQAAHSAAGSLESATGQRSTLRAPQPRPRRRTALARYSGHSGRPRGSDRPLLRTSSRPGYSSAPGAPIWARGVPFRMN
ncbi:hypothetical protein NDU88_003604 [Pleurodeles waltl]|uniref:Uncharacterized protein n=1 Tax=Pleurodeles waltl TaxID=8319 RepID=A0AAV7KVX2_PLEWA|nr:hypothetical protein NDU88_003604 [Pleurodeles waltl]